ncbi:MAG: hypothetical protein P8X42_18745 [Calditrichaceae bacterium]
MLNNDSTRKNIINKGKFFSNLVSSAIDKDGNERDGNPDLGAYEVNE